MYKYSKKNNNFLTFILLVSELQSLNLICITRQEMPNAAIHSHCVLNHNNLSIKPLHSHRRAKVYPVLINYCIT